MSFSVVMSATEAAAAACKPLRHAFNMLAERIEASPALEALEAALSAAEYAVDAAVAAAAAASATHIADVALSRSASLGNHDQRRYSHVPRRYPQSPKQEFRLERLLNDSCPTNFKDTPTKIRTKQDESLPYEQEKKNVAHGNLKNEAALINSKDTHGTMHAKGTRSHLNKIKQRQIIIDLDPQPDTNREKTEVQERSKEETTLVFQSELLPTKTTDIPADDDASEFGAQSEPSGMAQVSGIRGHLAPGEVDHMDLDEHLGDDNRHVAFDEENDDSDDDVDDVDFCPDQASTEEYEDDDVDDGHPPKARKKRERDEKGKADTVAAAAAGIQGDQKNSVREDEEYERAVRPRGSKWSPLLDSDPFQNPLLIANTATLQEADVDHKEHLAGNALIPGGTGAGGTDMTVNLTDGNPISKNGSDGEGKSVLFHAMVVRHGTVETALDYVPSHPRDLTFGAGLVLRASILFDYAMRLSHAVYGEELRTVLAMQTGSYWTLRCECAGRAPRRAISGTGDQVAGCLVDGSGGGGSPSERLMKTSGKRRGLAATATMGGSAVPPMALFTGPTAAVATVGLATDGLLGESAYHPLTRSAVAAGLEGSGPGGLSSSSARTRRSKKCMCDWRVCLKVMNEAETAAARDHAARGTERQAQIRVAILRVNSFNPEHTGHVAGPWPPACVPDRGRSVRADCSNGEEMEEDDDGEGEDAVEEDVATRREAELDRGVEEGIHMDYGLKDEENVVTEEPVNRLKVLEGGVGVGRRRVGRGKSFLNSPSPSRSSSSSSASASSPSRTRRLEQEAVGPGARREGEDVNGIRRGGRRRQEGTVARGVVGDGTEPGLRAESPASHAPFRSLRSRIARRNRSVYADADGSERLGRGGAPRYAHY